MSARLAIIDVITIVLTEYIVLDRLGSAFTIAPFRALVVVGWKSEAFRVLIHRIFDSSNVFVRGAVLIHEVLLCIGDFVCPGAKCCDSWLVLGDPDPGFRHCNQICHLHKVIDACLL